MPVLKLFDGTTINITEQQRQNIKRMIERDYKLIEVNGNDIKPSAIAAILRGGLSEADRPRPKALPSGRAGKDSLGYKKFLAERKKLRNKKMPA